MVDPIPPIVTFLTDFGVQDSFVGQMKGAVLSYCRNAILIDLTHGIPPQSVQTGSIQLAASWDRFPPGTIHVAVVDPGVGSSRRAIAMLFKGHVFIGPDNGLFSAVIGDDDPELVVELDVPSSVISRTFHGRDVFAPAAGRIAAGATIADLGSALDPASLARNPIQAARVLEDRIEGEIILIDHYGNAITNISAVSLGRDTHQWEMTCGELRLSGIDETYVSVHTGEPLALISSMGTLELAVRDGSAAARYDLVSGMTVTARRSSDVSVQND